MTSEVVIGADEAWIMTAGERRTRGEGGGALLGVRVRVLPSLQLIIYSGRRRGSQAASHTPGEISPHLPDLRPAGVTRGGQKAPEALDDSFTRRQTNINGFLT